MLPLIDSFYSLPYLLVALIYILLIVFKVNQRDTRIISSLLFIVFFGTRGLIGWDWQSYYPMFKSTPTINDLEFQSFFILDGSALVEPGFTLYISVVKSIFGSWELFILFSTLIDWFFLDAFIRRYSSNYAFSVLIYICLCLGTEVDLLRNAKSLLIFLFAIRFIEEHKIIPYLILIFIASIFHYSALIFIPLYFLGYIRMNRSFFIGIFLVANIIYLLHIPLMGLVTKLLGHTFGEVIGGKIDDYATSNYVRGITFGYFFKVINSCLIIWKYNNIYNKGKFTPFFLILYIIMIFVTFAMNDISSVSERIEDLFMPVNCILFPILINVIINKRNKRLCMSYLMIFLCLKLYSDTKIVMYNYDSFLINQINFAEREKEYGNYAYHLMNK